MPVASPKQWDVARSAVIEGGTYEDAASASGIPLSTIQKRAREEGWQAERAASEAYSARVRALKGALLKRVEDAAGAADADTTVKFMAAWRQAEAAYPELRKIADIPRRVLLEVAARTIRAVVAYLSEHDRAALAALQPHLAAIGDVLEREFHG